jgi:hypothetical protein
MHVRRPEHEPSGRCTQIGGRADRGTADGSSSAPLTADRSGSVPLRSWRVRAVSEHHPPRHRLRRPVPTQPTHADTRGAYAVSRRRTGISRSLRRIIDATEDLVDDVLDRSEDLEHDLRHSLSRALDSEGDDHRRRETPTAPDSPDSPDSKPDDSHGERPQRQGGSTDPSREELADLKDELARLAGRLDRLSRGSRQ